MGGAVSFIPQRKGKPMTTPKGLPLAVPTQALAQAIEAEWSAVQGIVPKKHQIPMTQYANTAIDHIAPAPQAALAGVISDAHSDLLCYREDKDKALAARQHTHWQPWLDWVKTQSGADLAVFTGLMPQTQRPEAVAALGRMLEGLEPFRLLALSQAAGLTGSAVLALAWLRGELDAQELFQLATLDEAYQIEQWGEPEELAEKRADLRRELTELTRYRDLLG